MRLGSNKQSGFTLIELMVVLTIAGVMVGIAAPMMSESIAKRRVYGDYKSIRDVLRTAKSAGTTDKRFNGVVVCPSTDGIACSGTNWSDGFIGCGDVDSNNTCTAADEVVAIQDKLSNNIRLTVTDQNNSGATVSTIRLTQQGYTTEFSATSAPIYLFTYCNIGTSVSARARTAMGIVYGAGGVIRLTVDTNNDGIQDYGSVNLTCPSS
jgi:type IV fimbrial biogenesis protein FimT